MQASGGGGSALLQRGYLGVDGFFLLSGVVLGYAHPVSPISGTAALRFWARRLLRLYPVHAATLGLLGLGVVAAALLGTPIHDPGRFGAAELVRSILLVQGWGFSGRWAWNYPSWSISTEWAGYLLFPALWLGVSRLGIAAVMLPPLALAALFAVGDRSVGLNLTYEGALLRFLPEFIAGMALIRLAQNPMARHAGGPAALVASALATLLAALLLPDAAVVGGLWCVLACLTVSSLHGRRRLDRLPGLRWLGELSYAFYMSFALAELGAVGLLRRAGTLPTEAPLAYAALTTALALALAILLHRCIEVPAVRRFGPLIG